MVGVFTLLRGPRQSVGPLFFLRRQNLEPNMTDATNITMRQIELDFERGREELYRRLDEAHAVCGTLLQNVETEEQKAAVLAASRQEQRLLIIHRAREGEMGPYLEMLQRDREAAAAKATAKVASKQQEQRQQSDERIEPSFDAPRRDQIAPASFEQTESVLALNRRLAIQDYFRHVNAAADAAPADRKAAVARVAQAEKAARLADSAYQSLMSAEAEHRASTVSLLKGDLSAAARSAKTSGYHLDIVADKLDRFSEAAPRSRFFQSTMDAVIKVDQLAGRIEASVTRTVDSFSAGLKTFAERVRALGATVARTPAVVANFAQTAKVSLEEATRTAATSMLRRAGGFLTRANDKVEEAKSRVANSAWAVIDDATDYSVRMRDKVRDVADAAASTAGTVERHMRASAGLAGTLMSRVSSAVREGYGDSLKQVDEKRAQRRPGPR